jgi:hypothetical protein
VLLVKRYGGDAMLAAAARANQLLEDGDPVVAATWHRILDAIERLQAKAPTEGEKAQLTPPPAVLRASISSSRRFRTYRSIRSRFGCFCACSKSHRSSSY